MAPLVAVAIAAAGAGAAVATYAALRRYKTKTQCPDDDSIVTITLPSWATPPATDTNTTATTTNSNNNNTVVENSNGSTEQSSASSSSSSSFNLQQYAHHKFTSDNEMMFIAISLSDANVTMNSGGPFGAAIFERHYYCENVATEGDDVDNSTSSPASSYCTLVSIGMNRVVPLNNSTCHGEMVAIQLAQKKMGSFTLNMMTTSEDEDAGGENTNEGKNKQQPRQRQFELFTSCEPCAMCLGATLWSGVSRIVCAATKDDAQEIGFDEGPVYESSYTHLENCGVKVSRGVMREEAQRVLRRYAETGLIYNR
ncbi:hypothetical protein ACHAWU_006675 [Discostella pseudostelligera]|uniref:CMP/dCMP-type deaminase domain-containing protein n=1 Tax=Discostella pseudostelligera TaxID=259834 RepID=A0ABD3M162_9STRA